MTWKHFTPGQILTADDANLLMDQGRIIVADAAERDLIAAHEGMRAYRLDAKAEDEYTSGAWRPVDTGNVPIPLPSGATGLAFYRITRSLVSVWGNVGALNIPTDTIFTGLFAAPLPAAARPPLMARYVGARVTGAKFAVAAFGITTTGGSEVQHTAGVALGNIQFNLSYFAA